VLFEAGKGQGRSFVLTAGEYPLAESLAIYVTASTQTYISQNPIYVPLCGPSDIAYATCCTIQRQLVSEFHNYSPECGQHANII